MAAGFQLNVITQEKTVLSEEVTAVTAPGTEGYLGIWRNHAPLVTGLIPGKLTVRGTDGRETIYALSGGFLEVSRNTVTILADAIERPSEIDVDRARRAAERARERLAGRREEEVDFDRAEAALKRALMRMRLGHHQETSHPG